MYKKYINTIIQKYNIINNIYNIIQKYIKRKRKNCFHNIHQNKDSILIDTHKFQKQIQNYFQK